MSKFILIFIIFCIICKFFIKNDTFNVLTSTLPTILSTDLAFDRPTAYILKQTHEPLFYSSGNGEYSSHLLSDWSRNSEYTDYLICPNKELKFEESTVFDELFLYNFLNKKILNLYEKKAHIKIQNGCVVIVFPTPTKRFLFDLSLLDNAPTFKSSKYNFDLGLGDFSIESWDSGKILLRRKTYSFNGFNKIAFYGIDYFLKIPIVERPKIQESNTLSYSEFNKIKMELDPTEYTVTYNMMNTVVLLNKIKDASVRKLISSCVDISSLSKGIYSNNEITSIVSTLIPKGMKGSKEGPFNDKMVCPILTFKKNNKYIFYISERANQKILSYAFNKLKLNTGIDIIIKKVEVSDLSNRIDHGNYDLIGMYIDTTNYGYKGLFMSLIDSKDGYLKLQFPFFNQYRNLFKIAMSIEEELKTALELQSKLIDLGLIIPIGPTNKKLRIPAGLRDIKYNDDFLMFPKVSDILIERKWYVI